MGFFSFNGEYYANKICEAENKILTQAELYEIKQLLKVLTDLSDEGYTDLNKYLEEKYHCISRIKKILKKHGESPFPVSHIKIPKVIYGDQEHELYEFSENLIFSASNCVTCSENPIIKDIIDYCNWLEYDENTAYVFLFRDAFLPYVYFFGKGRKNIYPWLINRAFLRQISEKESFDDEIRLPIYEALENGITEYTMFKKFCEERILAVLEKYPSVKTALTDLLKSITAKKITVVESGYCGTVPLMMTSIDERVDFRLFTTAPFLYETYKERIFCRKYEKIRSFETLYSQNVIMKYSRFENGKFFVKSAVNSDVTERSLAEIKKFLKI